MSLTVSVNVKQHLTVLRHWSQLVPNVSTDIRGDEALPHHHYLLVWLSLFNADLSLKRYWLGPKSQEVGEVGGYTQRYIVTTRTTPVLRWAAMRAILIFH